MTDIVAILKQLPDLRTPEARRLVAEARQEAFDDRAAALMALLRAGDISLADWVNEMKREIKRLHTTSAAVGKGDWRAMTQADWGRVGREVRTQYDYLRGFVNDLVASDGLPLADKWDWRALLYAGAAWGTFSRAELNEMLAQGQTQYKWTLGVAEHCPDCLEYADHGWVPIGSFDPVFPGSGHTVCMTNCHCHLEYRGGPEA